MTYTTPPTPPQPTGRATHPAQRQETPVSRMIPKRQSYPSRGRWFIPLAIAVIFLQARPLLTAPAPAPVDLSWPSWPVADTTASTINATTVNSTVDLAIFDIADTLAPGPQAALVLGLLCALLALITGSLPSQVPPACLLITGPAALAANAAMAIQAQNIHAHPNAGFWLLLAVIVAVTIAAWPAMREELADTHPAYAD
ncbi:hypothetical protein ABGB08_01400 [Acrocarpospora sp. B8E8]